jgi:hypothetical protein
VLTVPNGSSPTVRSILETLQSPSAGRRLPKEIEDAFFSSIRVRKKIAKKTYAHRLGAINEVVNPLLPVSRPLRIMDVGISSGVSTLEWMESIEGRGIDYHLDAVDLMVRGVLINLRKGVDVLADTTGRPLLVDLKGKWIPFPPGKRDLIRHFFSILVIRGVLHLIASRVAGRAANREGGEEKSWFTVKPVSLVYSELRRHPRVSVIEGNLLERSSLPTNLHVIRAANILNYSYFNDDQLSAIFQNLRDTLCEGGILVVCKTDDWGQSEGTVLRRNSSGSLEVVEKINDGSEVEELACRATSLTRR